MRFIYFSLYVLLFFFHEKNSAALAASGQTKVLDKTLLRIQPSDSIRENVHEVRFLKGNEPEDEERIVQADGIIKKLFNGFARSLPSAESGESSGVREAESGESGESSGVREVKAEKAAELEKLKAEKAAELKNLRIAEVKHLAERNDFGLLKKEGVSYKELMEVLGVSSDKVNTMKEKVGYLKLLKTDKEFASNYVKAHIYKEYLEV
ncbi:unnamed protein product [Peronospora belbahrii]|uniref:RxLR effector protein n=1 Tax=Peronospora belbahrii TaxID=622444 RepID=A0AAU9KR95_9STRA|nr:unnamed protein product [Peronospora belbahrii]